MSVIPWRVLSVEPLPNSRLHVEFADGTTGEVDLDRFLADARMRGTVFELLREAQFFMRACVADGGSSGPTEQIWPPT